MQVLRTTHEVVDDRVDGAVEIAKPVRNQGNVRGHFIRQNNLNIPEKYKRNVKSTSSLSSSNRSYS